MRADTAIRKLVASRSGIRLNRKSAQEPCCDVEGGDWYQLNE